MVRFTPFKMVATIELSQFFLDSEYVEELMAALKDAVECVGPKHEIVLHVTEERGDRNPFTVDLFYGCDDDDYMPSSHWYLTINEKEFCVSNEVDLIPNWGRVHGILWDVVCFNQYR